MSKKYFFIIIIIVATLLAGIFGFLLLRAPEAQEENAVLIYESGEVSYRLNTNESYIRIAEVEIDLPTGSYVRTGEGSFASIFLPDNSLISLAENTEIQINYSMQAVDLKQLVGETWNRVQTLSNGGSFQVESPNTIAAVRGTIFNVTVDQEENTTVHVDESKVEVKTFAETNGEKQFLNYVELNSGEWVKVNKENLSELEKERATEEFTEREWVKRNKQIDEEYNNSLNNKRDSKTLREEIRQKLKEKNGNGGSGDVLGLETETISEELEFVEDILVITHQTCKKYSQSDIRNAIGLVENYRSRIEKSDGLIEILGVLLTSCEGGQLGLEEAQSLKALINRF